MLRQLRIVALGIAAVVVAQQALGDDFKNPMRSYERSRYSNSVRHARDNGAILYEYVETVPTIQPPVVEEQVQVIGADIEKAKKSLSALKSDKENPKDVMECCKGMEKHLQKAEAAHKELKEKVAKGELDKEGIKKCCREICHELDHSKAEHDKLKKMVNHKEPEVPAAK